jgi:AraC family transcriptional regulator, regulatory protein of adaptative response / methylated-DNA-[protein]-cysteine methyltransferase
MIKTDLGRALSDSDWAGLVMRAETKGFYAVITTGIVCRHGCSARTPLRKNVRLFDSVDAAIFAGFRACLRCRPTASTPKSLQ